MPQLEIKTGSYRDVASQSLILDEHYEELAKNKKLMVLKPNIISYKFLEDNNQLFTLIAYKNNKIIGYSINILNYHLHYADLLVCYNDLLYLLPEYRGSIAGIKLIKATEQKAKELNAKLMLWHAKENTTLDNILPRMGCKLQEVIYSKEL